MRVLILAFTAVFFHAATAAADHKHVGKSDGVITGEEVLTGVISEIERRIIGRYYENGHYQSGKQELAKGKGKKKNGKKKGLPPGLAKRDHLPPGLQKHLDRRGTLPPGLAKRDLPPDLQTALPRRVSEELVIVNDDVVLIERATGVVLDVILGAARNDSADRGSQTRDGGKTAWWEKQGRAGN